MEAFGLDGVFGDGESGTERGVGARMIGVGERLGVEVGKEKGRREVWAWG